MFKKCKGEVVTINYKCFGNTEYTTINSIYYNPDVDVIIIMWNDGATHIWNAASDTYTFITFEDGTEWNLKRA